MLCAPLSGDVCFVDAHTWQVVARSRLGTRVTVVDDRHVGNSEFVLTHGRSSVSRAAYVVDVRPVVHCCMETTGTRTVA